jgi:23S rRNA (cytosine1962-C5)-methyltransferase
MPVPRIILRPTKEKALQRGYPWVFANQVDRRRSDQAERGAVVGIESSAGHVFGLGLYHDQSLIAVRFLTTDAAASIDADFFRRRIDNAIRLRDAAFRDATHARLAFGESDGLPGTVIDRYGPPGLRGGVLTWTCLSYGMEAFRETIIEILVDRLAPDAIVERNDAPLRTKDGLEERVGVIYGSRPEPVEIEEAGVRFSVDVLGGPKTGFFIDQRLNRLATRVHARDRNVLDVFSADGGFGLHAAYAGAKTVHLLDASQDALDRARANAVANGLESVITTETADALDRLGELATAGAPYDLIILDPPSFASSRRHVEAASRAYQRINISALQILPAGGLLATASCSQAIDEDAFLQIVRYSARRAGARLRLLHRGTQPADHPVLDSMPDTNYLKFYLFQKLGDEVPA